VPEDDRDRLVQTYLDRGIGRRVFVKRLLASGISVAVAVSYADLLSGGTARASARRARTAIGGSRPEYHKTVSGFYNFYLSVQDNKYIPASFQTLTRGDSVSWTMSPANKRDHSVTERSGMGYFDSGQQPGQRIVFTSVFPAAGTFHYHCKDPAHAKTMTGTVKVPVGRKPISAPMGTPFTIHWGQKGNFGKPAPPAPPGFVFDVQIKRPGATKFVAFRRGTTSPSVHFKPTGHGTYYFRARLRNKANGKASGWSPINHINAT